MDLFLHISKSELGFIWYAASRRNPIFPKEQNMKNNHPYIDARG